MITWLEATLHCRYCYLAMVRQLVLGYLYDAAEFLDVDYSHVLRWQNKLNVALQLNEVAR